MAGIGQLLLLCTLASGCFLSGGRPDGLYLVNTTETEEPGNCTSFPSLEAALLSASSLPTVTISLLSSALLTSWNVSNSVTLLGEGHALNILGSIKVSGSLALKNIELASNVTVERVFNVIGELTMDNCEVNGFVSLPMHAKGKITVSNTFFRNNTKGVFASLFRGGNVTVSRSHFQYNAKTSGAVFYLIPQSGEVMSQYTITNCDFEENGVKGGNSVLFLYDMGTKSTSEAQAISFSECNFKGHPVATFQIASLLSTFSLTYCQFSNETQLLTGTLLNANMTLSHLSVTQSQGPLVVVKLSGGMSLANSNFTYIQTGPLVVVKGTEVSSSLISLSQVFLSNISNSNSITPGNLINALQVTVWLEHVTIKDFSADANGVFFILNAVLFTRHFVAINGSTGGFVVGMITSSTIHMEDTLIDNLSSGGTMTATFACSAYINRITFRGIIGFWQPIQQLYSTNLFGFQRNSTIEVNSLIIDLIYPGFPLIFVRESNMTLSNSVFAGPLGSSLVSILDSRVILRNVTFNVNTARSLFSGGFSSYIDVDELRIRDLVASSRLIGLYAGSQVHIKLLSMSNVTCLTLSRGSQYKMTIDEANIENSNIGALAYFSAYV